MNDLIKALREVPEMRSVDVHLGQFAASLDVDPESSRAHVAAVAAAFASRAVGMGDVCVSLESCVAWAKQQGNDQLPEDTTQWQALMQESSVCNPGELHGQALLALDAECRVYLRKYYNYEQSVAEQLLAASAPEKTPEAGVLADCLDVLFPPSSDGNPDWQRVAVASAIRQRFCVITGGPGTGKTRTVARLLCLLQQFAPKPLHMALVAPTGKAAARLGQSIQKEIPALQELMPEAAEHVPDTAGTVHRLLGYLPSGNFRHNKDNPLSIDVLLVDEASMLDLSMMQRLLTALPPHARIILLGDQDQLASVEAGNVLGDICADYFSAVSQDMLDYLEPLCPNAIPHLQPTDNAFADGICKLRHSYRFDGTSGIGLFAAAVNAGNWPAAQQLLGNDLEDLQLLPHDADGIQQVIDKGVQHFRGVVKCDSPQQALAHLSQFQLLCGLRKGPTGVDELNIRMQQALAAAGVVGSDAHAKGRPIMISQNAVELGLYNGDVGMFWPDDNGQMRAWFDDGEGGVRSVLAARLPSHDSCYAMTIHKTQGSEFTAVCIVLPVRESPVLSRQLLYTGVTRARKTVFLSGPLSILRHMVEVNVHRKTGLVEALK